MTDLNRINWEKFFMDAGMIAIRIIGIFIAYKIVKGLALKVLNNSFDNIMKRKKISEGRAKTLQKLGENIISYVLIFILAATLFGVFGLSVASLVAGAGVIGLAISFGAQGLVSDVVTGFFLLLERQIDVNDYVTVGSHEGIVEAVGLRTTQIRGFNGTLNYIPNREIVAVSNHSRGNMQALVDISISYEEDIDRVVEIMQKTCSEVAANNPMIVEGPNVLGVQAFGTSDVVLRVIAKTKNMEQWSVERQLRKAIKEAFDANGIEIPLPHQVFVQKNQRAGED